MTVAQRIRRFAGRPRRTELSPGNGDGPSYTGDGHAWDELARELDRARRYGRSFALIRIESRSQNGRSASAEAADAAPLRPLVRTVDLVWSWRGATFVLLPEVGREAAENFLARLVREAGHLLGQARVAVFPEDGVTSGALLQVLEEGEPITLPALRSEDLLREDWERAITGAWSGTALGSPGGPHRNGRENGRRRNAVAVQR